MNSPGSRNLLWEEGGGGRGGLSRTQTHHDVSVYRLQYKHYDTYGRCRSVSDKHLRHGGSGYETGGGGGGGGCLTRGATMYEKLFQRKGGGGGLYN